MDKIRVRKISDSGWDRWEVYLPAWADPAGVRASTWTFFWHKTAMDLMLHTISEYRKKEVRNA